MIFHMYYPPRLISADPVKALAANRSYTPKNSATAQQ